MCQEKKRGEREKEPFDYIYLIMNLAGRGSSKLIDDNRRRQAR